MLRIKYLRNVPFGTKDCNAIVSGYTFFDTERCGYWAFSDNRRKDGILLPYIPIGGKKALQAILDSGGFVSYNGMEIVNPCTI